MCVLHFNANLQDVLNFKQHISMQFSCIQILFLFPPSDSKFDIFCEPSVDLRAEGSCHMLTAVNISSSRAPRRFLFAFQNLPCLN